MTRATFKKTKHLRDLSWQIAKAKRFATNRARQLTEALRKPGAKIAAAEVWGRADRERARKAAKRSAAWTGARA